MTLNRLIGVIVQMLLIVTSVAVLVPLLWHCAEQLLHGD